MSAAHGNTIACYNIGTAYALGKGVEKNNELSFDWLNRAAEDNFMKAMFSVAEAYSKGRGTSKDSQKAFDLHLKLAENGFGKSQYHVAYAYFEGVGVEKNDKLAMEWFSKGAENGNVLCQYYTGYCYANGIGTRADDKKALMWYTRAAEQGHVVSRQIVEGATGKKVELKGDESPFQSYLNSAKNGDPDAMFIVGRCYLDGVGTEKDPVEAKKWFNKGAAGGNLASKRALMQMRSSGQ